MEFGTFSSPESLPTQTSSESKKDDVSKGKEKKKKSTSSAAALAEIATNNSLKSEQVERRERRTGKKESYWRKIIGENDGKQKPAEVPLFGIPKPGESSADRPAEQPTAEAVKSLSTEAAAEQSVQGDVVQVAEVDPAETAELQRAAREFTEIRLQEADGQLHEIPLSRSDTPAAAEAAADVALLRNLQENLTTESSHSVGEAVDAASRATAAQIENLSANAPETPTDDHNAEGPVSYRAEADPVDIEDTPIPAIPPPIGGAAHPPRGPGNGPYSPYFEDNYPSPPYASGGGVEAAPATVSIASARSAERAAAAQGVLAGGLVGYFVGRRRGKKLGRAESEKKAMPVRRGLERQAKNLQDSIIAKESHIKAMAREKMQTITRSSERQRFVEGMLRPTEAAAPQAGKETPLAASNIETIAAAAPAAGELYSRRSAASGNLESTELHIGQRAPAQPSVTESSSRLAAETLVGATVETIEATAPEQFRIIPFHKKAEDFTREEVLAAAEKVTVQGVSLKEMMQLGSLDERGARRVIAEFLEGGDVSAAVTREITEKELKYERDPRMRQTGSGGQQLTGVAGGMTAAAVTNGQSQDGSHDQSGTASPGGYQGPRPIPDPTTLKAIRDKQIATITMTTILVVSAVGLLAWLIGQ